MKKIKSFLSQDEQERFAFLRKFERVTKSWSGEGAWSYYRNKTTVFVNGKAKKEDRFSSFYYFEERNYEELNKILNEINQKIAKLGLNDSNLDEIEEIMRGVIYQVNKNEKSECYKANQLYKKHVKKYVKEIFEYYQTHEFNSRECSEKWMKSYHEIIEHPDFRDFSDIIKYNYLTFNTAFQFIFEYGKAFKFKRQNKEEFLNLILDTYAISSGKSFSTYRNIPAFIRNGNWRAVNQDTIERAVGIVADWYANDIESWKLNPIERACILHCELVRIQAFPDGNHRLARLIANESLIQSDFSPIAIDFDKRDKYNLATNKAIETHQLDDLIDIFYEQEYQNAQKVNRYLERLEKKLSEKEL